MSDSDADDIITDWDHPAIDGEEMDMSKEPITDMEIAVAHLAKCAGVSTATVIADLLRRAERAEAFLGKGSSYTGPRCYCTHGPRRHRDGTGPCNARDCGCPQYDTSGS